MKLRYEAIVKIVCTDEIAEVGKVVTLEEAKVILKLGVVGILKEDAGCDEVEIIEQSLVEVKE